jgi:hypothetical protein
MAVAFADVGTRANTSGATTLTPVIQSHSVGDLLIALVAVKGTGTTINTPSGWTQIINVNSASTINVGIFYRVATGSDSNPVFTWTPTAQAIAIIARFTGTSATGVGTNGGSSTGSSNPHTSASFNSTAANSLAVAFDFDSSSSAEVNTPAGWTAANQVTGTQNVAYSIFTKALTTSGSASGAISV